MAINSTSQTILVKNEVADANNGYYTVTTVGDSGTAYVLTRATDYDQSAEVVVGTFFNIISGTTNADTQWAMNNNTTITMGSTSITFAQLSSPVSVTATNGVLLTGTVLTADVSATGAILNNTGGGSVQLGINVDPARALTISTNELGVNVDNSTIAITGNALNVKTAGITSTQLAAGSVNLASSTVTGILPLSEGGTGSSLTATGGTTLIGLGASDSVARFITLGTGLSYDGVGHVLSSTASGYAPIPTSVVTVNTSGLTNTAYVANAGSTIQILLPLAVNSAVGDELLVLGNLNGAGQWVITQNASQVIHFGNVATTTGTGGSITSTNQWDTLHLKCVASNTWVVFGSQGNLTVV